VNAVYAQCVVEPLRRPVPVLCVLEFVSGHVLNSGFYAGICSLTIVASAGICRALLVVVKHDVACAAVSNVICSGASRLRYAIEGSGKACYPKVSD
jgi:hypothetical protein